jgi:hypothetical protein
MKTVIVTTSAMRPSDPREAVERRDVGAQDLLDDRHRVQQQAEQDAADGRDDEPDERLEHGRPERGEQLALHEPGPERLDDRGRLGGEELIAPAEVGAQLPEPQEHDEQHDLDDDHESAVPHPAAGCRGHCGLLTGPCS